MSEYERPRRTKQPDHSPDRDPLEAVFGYILKAFEHFAPQGNAIDEESLVRICLAANCPSAETARLVIQRMIELNILARQTDSAGKRSYSVQKSNA